MEMFTHTLHVWYAFLYYNRLFNVIEIIVVSFMNCGNAFCTTSRWIGTLIIDNVKPICDLLQPHGLICANEIHRDTSLSSSFESVVTSGSGVLHLIW